MALVVYFLLLKLMPGFLVSRPLALFIGFGSLNMKNDRWEEAGLACHRPQYFTFYLGFSVYFYLFGASLA